MFFPADIWFRAFVLTLAVELPIAGVLLRRYEPSRTRLLLLILFANLASHPAVWFIFTQWFLVGTPEYVIAAEGWAVGHRGALLLGRLPGALAGPGAARLAGGQRGLVPARAACRRRLARPVLVMA